MLCNYLFRKEYARLEVLEQAREWNRLLIHKEQAELKQRVLQELGTGKGMLLSFGVGCVAGLTFEQRERLSILKRISISQIASLISLLR